MPITPLPEPPSRSDPGTFSARADAFLAALPLFARELNTMTPAESAAALAQSLAGIVSHLQGAGLVALNPAMSYAVGTAGRAMLAHGMPLSHFPGADPTGTADSTAAITAALARQAVNGMPILVDGRFRYTAPLTVSAPGARLLGLGGLTESASSAARSASCLIKDFNGQGIVFAGDCQVTDGIQYDSTAGKSGDNVQVTGSRWRAPSISVTNAGRDGVRFGADVDPGSLNTNLWNIGQIIARACGRHGLHINDPVGSNDVGGGVCHHADIIGSGGDGIVCDNAWWITFVNVVSQNNVGVGMRITSSARAITALGGDLEGNTGGAQGLLEAGAYGHTILGAFWGSPPCWTDNSGLPGRNIVSFYDPSINAFGSGSAINVTNYQAGGAAGVNLYADTGADLVAIMRGTRVGTTGGRLALLTKVDGSTPQERLVIDQRGVTYLLGARVDKLVFPTFGSSVDIDAAAGNRFQINVSSGGAWTLNAPTNASAGQAITICVRNNSGAGVANPALPANFKTAAWSSPAAGYSRSYTLRYDGQYWVEEARTPSDVPN